MDTGLFLIKPRFALVGTYGKEDVIMPIKPKVWWRLFGFFFFFLKFREVQKVSTSVLMKLFASLKLHVAVSPAVGGLDIHQ